MSAPHGTRYRYAAGCVCAECHAAHRAAVNRRARKRAMGQSAYVPAGPVRAHVRALMDAGMGYPQVSKVSGVDQSSLIYLMCGKSTRTGTPPAKVSASNARALLAVAPAARALSRCKPGSVRRSRAKRRLARLHARNTNKRRDFVEKATTDLARRADLIRVEDLQIREMTRTARGTASAPGRNIRQKAGLNRSILSGGWGMFVARLQDKAPGRVEKVSPVFSSQRCSACGQVAAESRQSQSCFRCVACGHTANADVNAAINIAAGRAARGAGSLALKRRPQRTDLQVV